MEQVDDREGGEAGGFGISEMDAPFPGNRQKPRSSTKHFEHEIKTIIYIFLANCGWLAVRS